MARTRTKPPRFRFRKEILIDGNQRLILDMTHPGDCMAKGYLTVVSKNVLTDAPIVVGPSELHRDQWIALAEVCQEVVKLLGYRTYKNAGKGRSKSKIEIY